MNKSTIDKSISHFVSCSCGCQMLECEKYDDGDGVYYINFTIWSRGRDGKKLSLKERLRWSWDILRRGMPWADDIMANPEDARKLAEFILENLPKEDTNDNTKN